MVRFGLFSTGLPTIEERSTGFLLEALDPTQIRERFGEQSRRPSTLQRRVVRAVRPDIGAPLGRVGVRARDQRRSAGAAPLHPDRRIALRDRAARRLRGGPRFDRASGVR